MQIAEPNTENGRVQKSLYVQCILRNMNTFTSAESTDRAGYIFVCMLATLGING